MDINATLIVQMIVFALLVLFTMKFVWPPIIQAMHERQKKIADGLAAAERGEHEQQLAEERAKDILKEAKQQATDIIGDAQQRGNQIIEEAEQAARAKGNRIEQDARAKLEQEANRAKEALRSKVAGIAVMGAERILKREVDASAHQDVLDELASQV